LSRGFDEAGYPATPPVSYQLNRQLAGWNPPPQVFRAFGAHQRLQTFAAPSDQGDPRRARMAGLPSEAEGRCCSAWGQLNEVEISRLTCRSGCDRRPPNRAGAASVFAFRTSQGHMTNTASIGLTTAGASGFFYDANKPCISLQSILERGSSTKRTIHALPVVQNC
jgi:hypothetical protein